MAAVIHNFVLEQGTSLNKKFRWKTNDQSVDLTGFRAHSQFRESLTSNDVLIDLSTDNSGIVINPIDGLVVLVFKPEHTKGALWKKAMYDLELISPDGLVTRLVQGQVQLSREVTRNDS